MAKLTVIIATYNSEKTLARTLKSVTEQSFCDFECVLIDGASTDGTIGIIKYFMPILKQKGISVHWVSEPDSGIYEAWNKGLKIATGNWISFLGSDDVYLPNALEAYAGIIDNLSPETLPHLIYSNVDYVRGTKKVMVLNGTYTWRKFRRFMCIAHVGSFHSRRYFDTYGTYDDKYQICGDYELLLRAREKLTTLKLPQTTVQMEAGGISNHLVKKAFRETYLAKITSGGVPKFMAKWDYYVAYIKYFFKKH